MTLRVLVVDCSEEVARGWCALLTKNGFLCKYATSGAAATGLARTWLPGIAIVNLSSPEMNGYYLAQSLREIEGMEGVCIIGISDDADNGERRQQTRIERYLQQPVTDDLIIEAVQAGCSEMSAR